MTKARLQFNREDGRKFVRVMNRVIRKTAYYKDCVAKKTGESVLNEYQSTGKIIIINGMNAALYEIIMNYGGLFDGMFAKRILRGEFTKLPDPAMLNLQNEYRKNRKYQQKVTSLKHLVERLRRITVEDYVSN